MGTNIVALVLLLHLVFSANALNLTYSSEFMTKEMDSRTLVSQMVGSSVKRDW